LDGLLYVSISILTGFLSHTHPRKYLSDPTEDVRIAAENQLAEFLREIREVTIVRKHREEQEPPRETKPEEKSRAEVEQIKERSADIPAISDSDGGSFLNGNVPVSLSPEAEKPNGDAGLDMNDRDVGGGRPISAFKRMFIFVQTGFPAKAFGSTTTQ
jgi:hypothetical protein